MCSRWSPDTSTTAVSPVDALYTTDGHHRDALFGPETEQRPLQVDVQRPVERDRLGDEHAVTKATRPAPPSRRHRDSVQVAPGTLPSQPTSLEPAAPMSDIGTHQEGAPVGRE